MKPVYGITHPKFRYVPSHSTDIAKTIRQARQRQDRAWSQAHQEKAEREAKPANVEPIKRRKPA